jgi:hypothetical protein
MNPPFEIDVYRSSVYIDLVLRALDVCNASVYNDAEITFLISELYLSRTKGIWGD